MPLQLTPCELIAGIIVAEDRSSFPTRPDIPYVALPDLAAEARELADLGVPSCKLFVYSPHKHARAAHGLDADNLMVRAVATIKDAAPSFEVMTEVCACAYSENGECMLLDGHGAIDDVATHDFVGQMAVLHARAGADVAVAGLTHRGSVRAMREALDGAGYASVPVLASIQFHSRLYGPYRQMMHTEPTHGNTIRSQIDHTDAMRALEWTRRYIEEGATRLLLQPAMTTVDILQAIRKETALPLTAYSVSTELGLVRDDESFLRPGLEPILYEHFYMLRRCGADSVMTYVARDMARWLQANQ